MCWFNKFINWYWFIKIINLLFQNNTQNNTLNKNLYINQIGNERINLTPKQIKEIVGEGLNGAMRCVRNVNFNRKKPENHNFYSSSLEGQFCTAINEKTQQPENF